MKGERELDSAIDLLAQVRVETPELRQGSMCVCVGGGRVEIRGAASETELGFPGLTMCSESHISDTRPGGVWCSLPGHGICDNYRCSESKASVV